MAKLSSEMKRVIAALPNRRSFDFHTVRPRSSEVLANKRKLGEQIRPFFTKAGIDLKKIDKMLADNQNERRRLLKKEKADAFKRLPRIEDTFRHEIDERFNVFELANLPNINPPTVIVQDTASDIITQPAKMLIGSHFQPRNNTAKIEFNADSIQHDGDQIVRLGFYFRFENSSPNPMLLGNIASLLCRQDHARCKAWRPSGRAADQIRNGDQPQPCQGTRPRSVADAARPRRRGDRMTRRDFITLLGGAAAWPLSARAQQAAMPLIGFLDARSPDAISERMRAYRQGLKEAGYVEGENVAIVHRFAENQGDRLPELATDLVRRRVTMIATAGDDVALAAKAATNTIPIVFIVSQDPVRLGLVASLARPDGNLTGVNFFAGELVAKRLELLRELVPGAARVALLVNPTSAAQTELTLRELEPAARAMRIQLDILNAATRQEIDAAFAMIARERPDALFVGGDPFFTARRVQLVNLATRHAIPTAFSNRESAEIGGLMSYGTNIFDAWRQSGVYAGRVLRGAKPADLPVLQSTKFEFVINHQTARMLGVTVPDKLLVAADEVVDRRHATRHLHRRVHDGCRRGDGDLSAKRKRTVRAGLKSRCSTGSQRARSLAPPHQEGGAFLAQRRLCAAS